MRAWVHGIPRDRWIKGRLLVVRRSKQATEYARKKLKQRASQKQLTLSENTLKAAQYFFVWTTLPAARSQQQTLDLYRCRWQIELAFRRMKSLMGLGHLPKRDPESLSRLATRKTLHQTSGRTHDRLREKAFPLGLRIGRTEEASGVKPNICCVNSALPSSRHNA